MWSVGRCSAPELRAHQTAMADAPKLVPELIDSFLAQDGTMEPPQWLQVLQATPFDTDTRPAAVEKLCTVLHHVQLQRGDALFEEGDEGSDIYIILSGAVQVTKKASSEVIAVCHAGAFFGELALLYSDPLRRSSMSACEPTHIARMQAAELVKHKIDLVSVEATHIAAINCSD